MDERLAEILCPKAPIITDLNREGWLTQLAKEVLPLYVGYRLMPHRLTCGWPVRKGLAHKERTIGECHFPRMTNGYHDIFVSPTLDDSVEVAGVVCHELAHVAAGHKAGHKAGFVRVCKHVGLTKNPPRCAAPGNALEEKLRKITDKMGAYPHSKIQGVVKPVRAKDSVTMVCNVCGCRLRITLKWLTSAGNPRCGCGGRTQIAEEES